MISFGGLGGNNNNNKGSSTLPRDVKDAVQQCREATQQALQNRCSRMTIEFPVGTKFGVEKTSKGRSRGGDTNKNIEGGPSKAQLDQSDRELARLMVEMFQPVGSENIVVAFNDQGLADQAKQQWKDSGTAACRIQTLNRRGGSLAKSSKSKKKAKGFAAKLAAEVEDTDNNTNSGPFALPDSCEVALFVAPGPKELIVVEQVCEQVGMGTLVILLNARLTAVAAVMKDDEANEASSSSSSYFGTPAATHLFLDEFESVFCLAAAPQNVAPNGMVFRSYPGSWTLARKPKVGPPKPVLTQDGVPTVSECQAAFEQEDISDMEKNVETALENVANWFR